jgi:hypothetical protein
LCVFWELHTGPSPWPAAFIQEADFGGPLITCPGHGWPRRHRESHTSMYQEAMLQEVAQHDRQKSKCHVLAEALCL